MRGNPHPKRWAKFVPNDAPATTAFERQMEKLGLAGLPSKEGDEGWKVLEESQQLRRWAAKHKRGHYVPEVLLRSWGMLELDMEI